MLRIYVSLQKLVSISFFGDQFPPVSLYLCMEDPVIYKKTE